MGAPNSPPLTRQRARSIGAHARLFPAAQHLKTFFFPPHDWGFLHYF
jgi:hypothetical protein